MELEDFQLELFKIQTRKEREAIDFITDTSLNVVYAYSDKVRYILDHYMKTELK
jgi:hypothetical protein